MLLHASLRPDTSLLIDLHLILPKEEPYSFTQHREQISLWMTIYGNVINNSGNIMVIWQCHKTNNWSTTIVGLLVWMSANIASLVSSSLYSSKLHQHDTLNHVPNPCLFQARTISIQPCLLRMEVTLLEWHSRITAITDDSTSELSSIKVHVTFCPTSRPFLLQKSKLV